MARNSTASPRLDSMSRELVENGRFRNFEYAHDAHSPHQRLESLSCNASSSRLSGNSAALQANRLQSMQTESSFATSSSQRSGNRRAYRHILIDSVLDENNAHQSGRSTVVPNAIKSVPVPASNIPLQRPPPVATNTSSPMARKSILRSYSSQGWEPRRIKASESTETLVSRPEKPTTSNRSFRFASRSSLSSEGDFFGFEPHPAVRPLYTRATLGVTVNPELDQQEDETEYPGPLALTFILVGVCLGVFIISLDRNIVTTAIPKITAQFQSYDDIGWYGSGYLLTASAFQPLYGRIYTSFESKFTFLAAVAVFELGSLIGALSPSSTVLIFGRAVQGLGSAGILTGAFVVGTHSVRLHVRPTVFALVGILFGVGALCGPLIGGAFTDTIGWRWVFWINLPFGAVTFVSVLFCFKRRQPLASDRPPFWKRIMSLDLIGNVIFLGACVMLFLALQYSETGYSFSSSRCVGLLCGFGGAVLVLIGWMIFKGDDALIPPKIVCQRTVAASCGAAFCIYGALLLQAYYLPIWFQAVKGATAIESGVDMIPYMAANALFSLIAGVFVSKNGLFVPPALLGCALGTVGSGLLATLEPDTSTARWVGFEILISAGLGMAVQQGFNAVQTSLPIEKVPIGTAAVIASQSLGGAIFVSVGNTLLQNHLLNKNNDAVIPGVDVRAVFQQGATVFRSVVPASSLPALVQLYNSSLRGAFVAAIPLCGIAFLCSMCMEWRSVRTPEARNQTEKKVEA